MSGRLPISIVEVNKRSRPAGWTDEPVAMAVVTSADTARDETRDVRVAVDRVAELRRTRPDRCR